MTEHERFQSPFSWRYGSDAMRALWGETHKRRLWRTIWAAIARAQAQAGLMGQAEADDLAQHIDHVDVARALEIEAEIHHDLMAEVRAFAEQCVIGGPFIHLGATSADIEDNADALRLRDSMALIVSRLKAVLGRLADLIEQYSALPTMAFTHLQPAEPTTVGYRLALHAQDMLEDYEACAAELTRIRGKGLKGAVGTGASYAELLRGTGLSPADFEAQVMADLGLPCYPLTHQTYPRKQDFRVLSVLAGLAGSMYKFAFDLRILQSPVIGEWHEGFQKKQVGSSAMPFKRNPINAEKIDSLGRLVAGLSAIAWGNAAHSLLERTLDDSANRREILPTAFLAVEEMLITLERILKQFSLNEHAIQANLGRYGAFAATERVLMRLGRLGADRQVMHEVLREVSMQAWDAATRGETNPLVALVAQHPALRAYLDEAELVDLMDATAHVGDAPERAAAFVAHIRTTLESP
jgi:adenylosuccinate lyase